jgi:acyl-CoA synthetase (AMP-forming)/AMP-acid ligase II
MKYCHFIVLIALHSLATRIEAFSVLPRTAHCSFRTFSASSFVKSESSFIDIKITSFSSLYQGNDDDDGWGTEATNAESSTTSQERELATLRTGDVARYDEDGFFYITDRIKELIKVRGYQVAPAELEALLLTHPQLSDAAVIPVPDEMSGELPRAYVTIKDGVAAEDVTEEDIKAWVKERVAPFKRLAGGVRFIDKVPKSASGKILRRLLVDEVKAEQ